MATALSAQNSQAEANDSQASKQETAATSTATIAHVYTNTPPIPTAV